MGIFSRYKRADTEGGYIFSDSEINHYVAVQKQQIIKNHMLGDFDAKGNYFVKNEIANELINMKKYVAEKYENLYLICSVDKIDKFFHFVLKLYPNKATFCLLEKINFGANAIFGLGSYSNINSCILDEYDVDDAEKSLPDIFKKYNIVEKPDGKATEITDLSENEQAFFINLINRVKANYVVETKLLKEEEKTENVEKQYFDNMMKLLNSLPVYGAEVIKDFEKQWIQKRDFIKVDKPNFYETLNELLNDSMVKFEKIMPAQEKNVVDKFVPEIKKNYSNEINVILDALPSFEQIDITISLPLIKIENIETKQDVIEESKIRYEKLEKEIVASIKDGKHEPSQVEIIIKRVEKETQFKLDDKEVKPAILMKAPSAKNEQVAPKQVVNEKKSLVEQAAQKTTASPKKENKPNSKTNNKPKVKTQAKKTEKPNKSETLIKKAATKKEVVVPDISETVTSDNDIAPKSTDGKQKLEELSSDVNDFGKQLAENEKVEEVTKDFSEALYQTDKEERRAADILQEQLNKVSPVS